MEQTLNEDSDMSDNFSEEVGFCNDWQEPEQSAGNG